MIDVIKSLRRDERGTGTIELALSVPILAFILVGAVDMGMGYTERLALQQAAQAGVPVERVATRRVRDDPEVGLGAEVVDPGQRRVRPVDHVLALLIIEVPVAH